MIIISPYAQVLKNNKRNPKNYPYWQQLVSMIDQPIVQIGLAHEEQLVPDFRKNLSLDQLKELVNECTTWIGVDSFFQHFCWDIGKKGIVLWGPSNPKIFGHPENINLLRENRYLIPNQFVTWEQVEYQEERFVIPAEVIHHLKGLLN